MSWVWSLAVAVGVGVGLWPPAWPWRLTRIAVPPAPPGDPGSRRPPAHARRARTRSRDRHRPASTGRSRPRSATTVGAGDLAACVDLLVVALSAGAGLHEAVASVGGFGGPGLPLEAPAAQLRRGVPLLEVLDAMPGALGEQWQTVATTLALTATSGAPALPALRRLAAAERTRERRRVERRVRRLPVMLLVPLVTLVLPAFALVTFVPLLLTLGSVLQA